MYHEHDRLNVAKAVGRFRFAGYGRMGSNPTRVTALEGVGTAQVSRHMAAWVRIPPVSRPPWETAQVYRAVAVWVRIPHRPWARLRFAGPWPCGFESHSCHLILSHLWDVQRKEHKEEHGALQLESEIQRDRCRAAEVFQVLARPWDHTKHIH